MIVNPYPYSCVEVNIKEQKVRCYIDNELKLEADCVSGKPGGSETNLGAFHVFEKCRELCLQPDQYKAQKLVHYWIAFDSIGLGSGFHDAEWTRTKDAQFGKAIYKTDGTSGCVHLSVENMRKLYELTYLGMPVMVIGTDEVEISLSDYYRYWEQAAPFINNEEAWTKEEFPDATYHYFKEWGCLVSSLAILLRRYGFENNNDQSQFNPWTLNERLKKFGAFDSAADLRMDKLNRLYPIEYAGDIPYSREALISSAEQGYKCMVSVPGVRGESHYVVVDIITDDDVIIIDPTWQKRRLSEFDQVIDIIRFKETK